MVDLTYRDHRENNDSGNPNMLTRVANIAREAACNIYEKSPGAWLANNVPGTPLLDAHRALMDTLCDGVVPLPPPPPPPFLGGQCCGVNYRVEVTATLVVSNGQSIPFNGNSTVFGKVGKVRVENEGTGTNEITKIVVDFYEGPNCDVPNEAVPRSTQVVNSNGTTNIIVIDSVNVVRTDGQPDTCGNPPGVYPPGDLTTNDFDFNTTIEFSPSVDVDVNVSITPTVVLVGPTFSPELNVNVGGINVTASLGGFTFSPTINFNNGPTIPTIDPRPSPPPTKTPTPPPNTFNPAPDLDDIKRRIDDIQAELEDCCDSEKPYPEPDPEKVGTLVIGQGRSGVCAIPNGTFKVVLEITGRPTQEKIQFGLQGADVIYAGWGWYETQGAMGERTPVDALEKVYPTPARGGNKFHFTLYAGYSGIIRAYYIQ